MVYNYRIKREPIDEMPVTSCITPQQAYEYAMNHCYKKEDMWQETAYVIFLDKCKNISGHAELAKGGTDKVILDKKVVAYYAVAAMADSIIIVHNHPSGNCIPSKNDIRQTEDIHKGLKLLDIDTTDHIIISDNAFFSFKEETQILL